MIAQGNNSFLPRREPR